ncbi:unnamed protein product [Linum tenue]|uniref:Uncharacterized protein n=1 Tax=Linum tenue TaxID=586396 RepID=A0AAV0KX02_9ROSI|nr:unnamed protein product [Linum tenue]
MPPTPPLPLPPSLPLPPPNSLHRHPPPPPTAGGYPDPTRLHLLRHLHQPPAQQDPESETPPDLENPRLGPQSPRLFPILPTPPIKKPPPQLVPRPLRRGAGRAGGRGPEAGRGARLDRSRPRPVAAAGRRG